MLLSHAYYLTPRAASVLLATSKEWCNDHKQDWVIRGACIRAKRTMLNCTRPPRGLFVQGAKLDWRGILGWGLFVQDHHAIPSFTITLARRPKSSLANVNATELGGLVRGRCAVGKEQLITPQLS